MRKGRFPPFGFVSSEFWLCALVLQWFLAVFDFMDRIMDFLNICQKDAQGSVSPLRVRMKRVSALRTRFASVFGCSLIREAELWIFEAYARKMRKGRFPPSGFVSSEFGLCAFVLQWLLAVFDLRAELWSF